MPIRQVSYEKPHPPNRMLAVLALTAVGALIGGSWTWLFRTYEATVALPFNGDLQLFRTAEQEFRIESRQAAFAGSRTSQKHKADFEQFSDNVRHGLVRVEHQFSLTRRDLLDVPEVLSKGLTFDAPAKSLVRTTVQSTSPKLASDMAITGADFVRDTLVSLQVAKFLNSWKDESNAARRAAELDVLSHRSQVHSITRQIAAMEEVQREFGDVADTISGITLVSPTPSLEARHFLSPLRQIVALKSALVDAKESLLRLQHVLDYLNALRAFASASSEQGLDGLIAAAERLTTDGGSGSTDIGTARAAAEIKSNLSSIHQRLATVPYTPAEPIVKKVGVGVVLGTVIGGLLGLFAGLGLVYAALARSWWSTGQAT